MGPVFFGDKSYLAGWHCGLVLLLAGCVGQGSDVDLPVHLEGSDNDARVETLVLAPDTFDDVIEITGSVESLDDAVLSAESAGAVRMLARLGARVAAGTVVARLDQRLAQHVLEQAEAAVENAEAVLALAQDNHDRLAPLFRDSIVSALEFHEARTRLQQAYASARQSRAQRAQAEEQLNYTLIRAPFAGTVEEHRVMVGERVGPGTPVIRIIDTRRVKVTIGVPESYAGDIEVGTRIELDVPALGDLRKNGSVTFAGNTINPNNRTFSIEAEVDNRDGRLKPEMIANVLISRQRIENVLIIPRIALVRDEDGTGVFVADRSGDLPVAVRRLVRLGATYAERVIVENGLVEGDEVIVLGHNSVTEGAPVEIVTQYQRLDQQGIPAAN